MLERSLLARAEDLSEDDWRQLATGGDPFLTRAFLGAAERCVAERGPLGWQPMHIVLRHADRRIAALLPLYVRHHWYGDFAMDYGWEPAWRQAGLAYFPKLVSGVPFTPSPGPRLLLAGDYLVDDYPATLESAVRSSISAARTWLDTRPWPDTRARRAPDGDAPAQVSQATDSA